jgi:peptidoglycan/xylan/chitin deacetylase (PgdA/CDA1 family)
MEVKMIILLSGLIGLFVAWLIIYPVTDYYTRIFDRTVLKRGCQDARKLYLSFDDGPDRNYTPALLQILKAQKITATFFLIGRKAEQNPELVAAILADGHEIGLHTYAHRHAYGMFRKNSYAAIQKGLHVLQALTGKPVAWLRMPWGAANLFERLAARQNNLKLVLWTANAQDWLLKTKPQTIKARLLQRVKSGAIIVLHDSGGEPGAPSQMLQALPATLQSLKAAGYQFRSLSEIAGGHQID